MERVAAEMSEEERLVSCVSLHPSFLDGYN
jgi:hypothetical protein